MSWGDPAGYAALLTRLGPQRACPMGSGGRFPHWGHAPLFPPLPAPLGMAVLTRLGPQRACPMGSGGRFPHWRRATLLSTSSPSSFSGERSTELKIPSFQQWALPSDHQHPSRSPAKVTSTEQKTVLCLRKPLELEELRARNRRHFFCHLTLL